MLTRLLTVTLGRVLGLCTLIVGCAGCTPLHTSRESAGQPARLDSLRLRIDTLADPWPDASSAISLVRDSGDARALTPREMQETDDQAGFRWKVVYGVDPSALHTELDRADAGILRVTEWISREEVGHVVGVPTHGRGVVVRRFKVEGLAAGRTIVVDVPLRAGRDSDTSEGTRWQAFVNGAPIEAPLGASHIAIELSRDEATVIRVGRVWRAAP